MTLKVYPRAVPVGAADMQIHLSIENHGAEEVRDVTVEWDIPQGFLDTPAKAKHKQPATRRSRGPSLPVGTRTLTPGSTHSFVRIAPKSVGHGVMPLKPSRPGRYAVRIKSLTWLDAKGARHTVQPDTSASFVVEEPQQPEVHITARCPSFAALGEPVPVELRVENRGNLPARGLTISFDLPDGIHVADGDALPTRVATAPIDVAGKRHAIVRVQLLPEGPTDVTIGGATATYADDQGQSHSQQIPDFSFQMAVRVDPARVFVGRDRHRERLGKLLESVALPGESATSRLVLVAGKAGIGKSRLVEEVKSRARLGGYLVAEARLTGPTSQPSLSVLRSLIVSLLELQPLLSHGGLLSRGAIESHFTRIGRALTPAISSALVALVPYLRVDPTEEGPSTGGLADLAGFLTDLVRHLSRLQPVLLAIDDVHWSSAADRRTLARLLVGTRDCRLLVLMTYREEQARPIADFLEQARVELGATELRLGALNYEACRALITENFSGANFPDWLVRAIHTRSRGVPLYEVEALRCLVQDGVVRFDPGGGWKADEQGVAAAMEALPGTATGLLAHQVSMLRRQAPQAAQILSDAAVLDTDATADIIAEMTRLDREVVDEAIRLLVVRGFLREPASPGAALEFSHPLKREVALPGPLDLLQRHRAAAEAIARVAPDAMAGSVAVHLVESGRRGEALPWYLRWARHSSAAGAFQDALAGWHEATRLLEDPDVLARAPDVEPRDVLRPYLQLLMERGSASRSLDVAGTLQELARAASDRAVECEAAVGRARSLSRLGRDLEALQAFYAAIELAEEAGRPELAVTASLEMSEHYRDRDREEPARRVARNAAERYLALPPQARASIDPVALVAALCRSASLDEASQVWDAAFDELVPREALTADATLEDLEQIWARPDDAQTRLKALRARSYLVAYTEGEDAVAGYLERCIAAWAAARNPDAILATLLAEPSRLLEGVPDDEAASWLETLSRALWLSGSIGRALEMLDASWLRRGHQASLRHRARYLADRSSLLADLERGSEAAAHAAEYVQVARQLDEPHQICDAVLNAANLALSAGDSAAAETLLDEGMRMARERSMPSLLCRAQLQAASLELSRGHAEEALSRCRQARRLAEDHGLSPELVVGAATECARCRAAMGDLKEAAAEVGAEARKQRSYWNPSYALGCFRAEAGYLLQIGDLDGARKALEEAVALPSGRPGWGRQREEALRELAEILMRQGDLEEAVRYIDESLSVRARALQTVAVGEAARWVAPASSGTVSVLEHLASLTERLQLTGQGAAARELLSRALQTMPDDESVAAPVRMALARIEAMDGELSRARSYLEAGLKALGPVPRKAGATASPEERRRRRARILVRTELGRVDALMGNFDRARTTLEGARREAQRLGDEEATQAVLSVLGRVYEELGQVDEARAAWEEVIRTDNPSLSSSVRLEAFMGLARLAVAHDNLDEATSHVQAAEEVALEAGWTGVAMMGQVAEAWEVLGQPERSLGLIERALSIVRLAGVEDRARLPGMLQVVARLLCQVEPPRYREAVAAAEEAVEVSRRLGEPSGIAENLEGMAHILILSGEETRAVETFESALHLYERLGVLAGAGRVRGHLARLMVQMGDPEGARAHLDEAMRLGGQVRATAPDVLAEALLTAASLAHEQGHAADAAQHLLSYLDLGLANSDVGACALALHGLQDQPPGWDLSRVSVQQWVSLDGLLDLAAPSDESVSCRLAGVAALEMQQPLDEKERDRWLDESLHLARHLPPSRLDPATLDDLARALERRGDFEQAANVYRVLSTRPETEETGGDVEEMRAYACGRAGELLTQAGNTRDGLQMYLEAEGHAARATSPIRDPGLAWNAFAIASILLDEGRSEESASWYRKAVQRWQALIEAGIGEPDEQANFMAMLSLAQAMAGDTGESLATLERFRARLEQQGASLMPWMTAVCDLAEALVRQGEFGAASYGLNEVLPYVEEPRLPELACRVYTMLSWVAVERKDVEQALQWADRAVREVAAVTDPSVALQAWVQASTLYAWMRDGEQAARCHREVLKLAGQMGDWKLVLEHRESLVLALAGANRLSQALQEWETLQAERNHVEALQPSLRVPRKRFALASVNLRAERAEDACSLLELDIAEARTAPPSREVSEELAFLLSWLGTARHQAGDLVAALDAMRACVEAVEQAPQTARGADRSFSDESLASVYLEMSEILARMGRWEEAEKSVEEALLRRKADPWVDRRVDEFAAAIRERKEPPHADPMVM